MSIRIEALGLAAGVFHRESIDMDIATGRYAVLMGRTGCGKTTLLETICGLRPARSGSIFLSGRDVTDLSPADRQVGYVPQEGALFPHLSVRDQLAFPLRFRGYARRKRRTRVAEIAAQLELDALLRRPPTGLSGGERQRVALGRALAAAPPILCLDEPLSALDDESRESLYAVLSNLPQQTGVTTLHVTHNRHEAAELADERYEMDANGVRSSGEAS